MLHGQRVVVVLPAYQAEQTLSKTYQEMPRDVVDDVLVVDDASLDATAERAAALGLEVIVHDRNAGYGANQKTCYREALQRGADIVVMLHPDYQYEPRLVTAMASMIASGVYDVVLGSRILGGRAMEGGMPAYKYLGNRVLTFLQNVLMGTKLSEFHTGYRAFSRRALESLPLHANSNDFLFDNQILAQAIAVDLPIGEISCPTRYDESSSSISFGRSVRYAAGVLYTALRFRLWRLGLCQWSGRRPEPLSLRADVDAD